uniref:Retrotransposon polyprotein n=1 Tax=Solanum tuberosum TaxID=4113 RepID=M1DG91_SOLTU
MDYIKAIYENPGSRPSKDMTMEVLEMVLTTNKGLHALKVAAGHFREPEPIGGSPKSLGDDPSSPFDPERWWTQEERLRALQGNTHPLTWEELKRLMRFKYVPKGYIKLFNVDPRRPDLRTKVGICGALGVDLVLDDGYNLNYIPPEVVTYLGLPQLHRTYSYTMEGCKVTEGVKFSFTCSKYYEEVWCDIMPMDSCHLNLGANWFNEHRVPNE